MTEKIRRCPRCRKIDLQRRRVEGAEIEVDMCPGCGGIWFDAGELENLLDELAADFSTLPLGRAQHSVLCPVCRGPLTNGKYPGTFVVVDYCNDCRGIWLDAGEFREIFAALEQRGGAPKSVAASRSGVNRLEALREHLREFIANCFRLSLNDWREHY